MRAVVASTARHLSRCRVPARCPPPADARRASGGECPPARIGLAARLATRRALGRGGRLRRRRVFVFPLVIFSRRRRRRRPRRILPRPDEAAVPGAPRSHGDERIPRATPLGRPRLRRPRSLRHETHRARHGTGGESPTRRRRARPETRAHRRLPALPRVAHRGPRLRGPRRRGGRRRAAQSRVRVRQRTRVPRLGRRSNPGRDRPRFPGMVPPRDARSTRRRLVVHRGRGRGRGRGRDGDAVGTARRRRRLVRVGISPGTR